MNNIIDITKNLSEEDRLDRYIAELLCDPMFDKWSDYFFDKLTSAGFEVDDVVWAVEVFPKVPGDPIIDEEE